MIKKMAIDYKKEWEELYEDASPELKFLMDTQIERTIGKRESLMKQYLINGMKTDVTGGDKFVHYVDVSFYKNVFCNIAISKASFKVWCKKKGDK